MALKRKLEQCKMMLLMEIILGPIFFFQAQIENFRE